uniref:CFA20 domain-containing protein n=1 Tax=Oryzias latipes TaxID=8090 RepID=A0A3P9H7Q2_ORYLA
RPKTPVLRSRPLLIYSRGREPMARKPYLALLMVTSASWGCKSPFLVMITYNKNVRRWFRMSKNQSNTKLEDGWNQIQFNLACFTADCLILACRLREIHVNRRIRRVFFTERLYSPCPSRGPESSVHLLDRFWVPSELRCSLCVLQK